MNHNNLTQVIEKMSFYGENSDTRMRFTRVMVSLIKANEWVFVPILQNSKTKQALCIVEMYDKKWVVMFSEEKMFRLDCGVSIVSIGIGEVIDAVFNDNEIYGIAINPFSQEHAYIPKSVLKAWS